MTRAQIYIGSWEDNPEEGLTILDFKNLITIKPGIQKVWESYYLVVDGELSIEHPYLPYKPVFDELDLVRYKDAGAIMGLELARRGLEEKDYEIINGKKVDFTDSVKIIRLINGVGVEDEKVKILRKSLLTVLNRFRGVTA